ncbi:MAG: 30S ribosomal protein S4 [Chloroflexota bacterium]
MGRYVGPSCRLCRYLGEKLMLKGEKCSTPKCPVERRKSPPGGYGKTRRRRLSDRGLQLREKQKVRFSYGVLERQFRRLFAEAKRMPGIAGDNLLIVMERRLDNVVYSAGFADSRAQARQVVRHDHIRVNGRKMDIPSYLVKEGDVISWHEGSTDTELYKRIAQQVKDSTPPGWLELDEERMTAKVTALPTADDIDRKFDGKAVVEYYSR